MDGILWERKERGKWKRKNVKTDFLSNAHKLIGEEVEVITSEGTYTGTLLSVGSDVIILRTRIRGRIVRLLIRLALIVALFRLIVTERRNPFGFRTSHHEENTFSHHERDEDEDEFERR